jgi:signal transduction histidine kinase/FixJ family two-component response regulator
MKAGVSAELLFLAGGGEMGERTRAMDWSGTAVGSPAQWPQSLKTAVSICLGSRHPMVLWWGRSAYTQFYNDAYISFLGKEKHPAFLGRSGRDCWSEIWPTIGPMLEGVYTSGTATWSEDLLLILQRKLPREEGYFTFSYSPIRDDDGAVAGIFCACNETTSRVLGERRLRTLRDLSRMEAAARTVETTCEIAARTLGENPNDIPFALIYLLNSDTGQAELVGSHAIRAGDSAAPLKIDLNSNENRSGWPLRAALDTGAPRLVEDLSKRFGSLPGDPWPEPSENALIVPIAAPGQTAAAGFLVSGLSPRRVVDNNYTSFLKLVAGHIGTSVANARAYDLERKRAETLMEIDRAKTLFFSNVSHEFRTPLTLMLGPLEDSLASGNLPAAERERLNTAHRNSLRLLKLVNSLLDFSRIEAGRAQASYEPNDLAAITTNIASNFRSACERAGLKLVVECEPFAEPVYVDCDMWEKIVLNLLSNAFKFTFEGEIAISLRAVGRHAELQVRDTGVGIPSHELPRLFERFHRIEGQRSRTYEGSGIGLALVQELVKLHSGTITAESQLDGGGTKFIVTIPLGRSHLPQDRIGAGRRSSSTATRADAFVEEALRWLPDGPEHRDKTPFEAQSQQTAPPQLLEARIFIADDNSDMRAYLKSLLGPFCELETFADGEAIIQAIRRRAPDLVLADVMMPRLDGFELVRAIRRDATMANLPVILLSARAGEEAKVEGLASGADDYLIKPFTPRELIARVSANLTLAKLRQQAAANLQDMNRLQEVANQCMRAGDHFQECLDAILETAIEISGADKGNIQLFDAGSNCLKIASQKGFQKPFLSFFSEVRADEGSASGHVLRSDKRVIVEDVTQSVIFAGQPSLDVLLKAEVRALQVTPLISSAGKTLGMLSTHFSKSFRPGERELRFIDLLARLAADFLERKHSEQIHQTILRELQHRSNNLLAVIQSIAHRSLAGDKGKEAFEARLQALARANRALLNSNWSGVELDQLVREELEAFSKQASIAGPAIVLQPQVAQNFTLGLHELATNAAKHGALSTRAGKIAVAWALQPSPSGSILKFKWQETGGPPVAAPIRLGFGTQLLKAVFSEARLEYAAEGFRCEIDVPLGSTREQAPSLSTRPPPAANDAAAISA